MLLVRRKLILSGFQRRHPCGHGENTRQEWNRLQMVDRGHHGASTGSLRHSFLRHTGLHWRTQIWRADRTSAKRSLEALILLTSHVALCPLQRLMSVNYLGSVYPSRAVISTMKERRVGRIVFVSSQAGQLGLFGFTAYSSSKFAIRGLAEALQMEVNALFNFVFISSSSATYGPLWFVATLHTLLHWIRHL